MYLAGIGIFGLNSAEVANATSLDPHRAWGTVLMVLSLILLILALIAWASRATVIWTFVLALLVIVAQTALGSGREQQVDRRAARPGRDGHLVAVAVAGHHGQAAPHARRARQVDGRLPTPSMR